MNTSIRDQLHNATMLLEILSKTLESEGDESRFYLAQLIREKLAESLKKLAG